MSRQTSVGRMSDKPFAAGLMQAGAGQAVHRKAGGFAAKVVDVTITAVNDTEYTLTLEQRDGTTKALSDTSDSLATIAEIRDAFILLVNEDEDVIWEAEANGNLLRLTCTDLGYDASISVGANLSASVTTSADAGDTIPFGLGVCQSTTEGQAELPTLTTPVAKVVDITPEYSAGDEWTVAVLVSGVPYTGVVTMATDLATTLDAMVEALNEAGLSGVATVTDGATKMTITSDTAGVDFEVTSSVSDIGGTSTPVTVTIVTENVAKALARPFLGIARYDELRPASSFEAHEYTPGATMAVETRGPIPAVLVTGQTPSFGDPVYLVASGSDAGKWRTSDASTAVLVPGASFAGSNKTALAGETAALIDLSR